jgi:hypothetical protein
MLFHCFICSKSFDINPFVKAVVVVALQILFRLNEQLNLHDALTEARDKK